MEEVSICGLSGRFPESTNALEFWENLIGGKDLVTEDDRRWKAGLWGLPKRNGKLKELDKFDASFFKVHSRQANNMDPQQRMLLEVSYEAIVDAGIDPASLAGSRTGVWIGVTGSEAHEVLASDPETTEGYAMTGCYPSMFANRVSYCFDFKGPSIAVDTACSSSLVALQMAYQSIRDGSCDAAVVGGANLLLKPQNSLQFQRLNMTSPDGTCRSFDASGKGYVKSEAVAAMYVCKKSAAIWSYCDVVHAKTNSDGWKKEGITFPSGEQQVVLLKETYQECGLDPHDLDYFETHGTGTKIGDPQELNAIDDVMCTGRQSPLLIGSVKSNMGHGELASGVCSLIKCVMAMQMKMIPPNLHFNTPNSSIPGLLENRLKVVTEPTPLSSSALIGINCFGFGGSNAHAILRSSACQPCDRSSTDCKPVLHLLSSRTEEGMQEKLSRCKLLTSRTNYPTNISPTWNPFRGYVINTCSDTSDAVMEQRKVDDSIKDVWFIFSGMGSQWKGMGKDLLNLPIFSETIDRCTRALECYNFNVRDLLMNADSETYDDPMNTFVGLTAVQVALIDILTTIGVRPAGIIGHSAGEIACSYADGCLTLEQTMQIAFWRGRCIKEAKLSPGAMAAVGLSWEECLTRCPPGVAPACHNTSDSVTITGVEDAVIDFVTSLQEQKVFAKHVKTGRIAFHSVSMQKVYPSFIKELRKIIPEPENRSELWVTSSASRTLQQGTEEYDLKVSKCSAEYHANNLCNPVMFHDAIKHVPDDVIAVEVSPHGLLQAILKRSLASNCVRMALADRREADGVVSLFKALGKLYCYGIDLKLNLLCDLQSLTVSRNFFGSLVDWDHSQTWFVPSPEQFMTSSAGGNSLNDVITIDPYNNSKDAYLLDHVIDGRCLLPAAAHLFFAWRLLARSMQCIVDDLAVQFNDVNIHKAIVLSETGKLELLVQLIPSSKEFRISNNGKLAASGKIQVFNGVVEKCETQPKTGEMFLKQKEIYRKLRLQGYQYKGEFQTIRESSPSGLCGLISFKGNYVTFIDAVWQLGLLKQKQKQLKIPTRIRELKIKPFPVQQADVPVHIDRYQDRRVAGEYVEAFDCHLTKAPRRGDSTAPLLQRQVFVPNLEANLSDMDVKFIEYKRAISSFLRQNITILKSKFPSLRPLIGTNSNVDPCDVNTSMADQDYAPFYRLLRDSLESCVVPFEMIKASVPKLSSDLLLSYCSANNKLLTTTVDVVLENVGNLIKVVELPCQILGEQQELSGLLRSHFDSFPNLDYNVIKLNTNGFESSVNESSISWDLSSAAPPPEQIQSCDLLVLNNPFFGGFHNASTIIKSACQCILPSNGFLLLHHRTQQTAYHILFDQICSDVDPDYSTEHVRFEKVKELLDQFKMEVVVHKSAVAAGSSLLLCRHRFDVHEVETIQLDSDKFDWINILKEHMMSAVDDVWLKADENNNGIVGMLNCLRKEPGGEKVKCIFNASLKGEKLPADTSDVFRRGIAINVYRDGEWGTFRFAEISKPAKNASTRAFASALNKGDFASLQWIGREHKAMSGEEFEVAYSALNFRDVMLASGKLPADAIPGNTDQYATLLGLEFSGYDVDGNRVMGLLPAEGLATHVSTDRKFTWKIPEHWSLEDAATVPVVYATAYYALIVRGNLRHGESVLIHGGAGGVGQAAIAIVLSRACHVFTTVSTRHKREYLMRRFPNLTEESFANSRDATFEGHVMRHTKGIGVDVVLNSLADEKLQASLRCVKKNGRFLEIGKFDMAQNSMIGMAIFLRNISFHGILLDSLFDCEDWQITAEHVTRGIQSGEVQPLESTVFARQELEPAFRYMAQGKHIGKVLIKMKAECENTPVIIRSTCDPSLVYIVTGGLGGFGLELCDWLVQRGARHIIITTRSGIRTAYQQLCVTTWRSQNVTVTVSNCDVSNTDEARQLLNDQVGGIFHLAMVLKDGIFANQTSTTFEVVCKPKCSGILNLDRFSRETCHKLRWFVAFSSVASGRGHAGQTNYGLANSFMDRVCEKRKSDGYPALSIQWGPVGDVGVAVETTDSGVIGGTLFQSMMSCLNTLDIFLSQMDDAIVSSVRPAPKQRSERNLPMSNSKSLVATVASIIGIQDINKVDRNSKLLYLGLDSLMTVEIMQKLESDFGGTMEADDLQQLTFHRLEEIDKNRCISSKDVLSTDSVIHQFLTPGKEKTVQLNQCKSDAGEPVWFAPPIMGRFAVYHEIASYLDVRSMGLLSTASAPQTSVPELAAYYLSVIGSRTRYRLVGYSFGACVVLEMARQLRLLMKDVDVLLIDGSHTTVAEVVKTITAMLPDEKYREVVVMASFVNNIIPEVDKKEVQKLLARKLTTDARLDEMVRILQKKHKEVEKFLVKDAFSRYHRRMDMASQYVVEGSYPGDITLIKRKQTLSPDYDLSEVCTGHLKVISVDADHQSIITGRNAELVASVIKAMGPHP